MLPFVLEGREGPLFVALHWLGGSSATWTEVSRGLAKRGARFAALDLPGFGAAAPWQHFSVRAMVDETIATIAAIRNDSAPGPWFLVGHSMGGKLASIVAAAARDGEQRLAGLAGIILLSPSPPGPEPMSGKQRQHLLDQLGASTHDAIEDRSRAQAFVDANVGKVPLLEAVRNRSAQDVLRMNRDAFVAWLTTGSKEDWSQRVGTLSFPALVLAGSEEPALGPEAQRTHTLPHLARATWTTLAGGGHLSPLERPAEVVGRVEEFVEQLGYQLLPDPAQLGADFSALIASDATSARTRDVMQARIEQPNLARAEYTFDLEQSLALSALVERVVPGCPFDLADGLQRSLSQGTGDGWRHDLLPPDLEAWKKGLTSLDAAAMQRFGVPFVALDAARQDDLLRHARDRQLGKGLLGSLHLGETAGSFDSAQMQAWFEDARGELTKLYLADPRTMERIGFTGFADEHGFTQIQLGAAEETR